MRKFKVRSIPASRKLSLFLEYIQRMVGSPDQILTFTDREVITIH